MDTPSAWQQQQQQEDEGQPLEPSAPGCLQVTQSRVFPVGDDQFYITTEMSRRRQFAVRPVSGLTQASVLSERTWATHDQYRSGLALADPIYQEDGGITEDEEEREVAAVSVLPAMHHHLSLSNRKLQDEEGHERSSANRRGRYYSDPSRLRDRLYSADNATPPSPPLPPPSDRASSEPFVPHGRASFGASTANGSVVSSTSTNNSTNAEDRIANVKKNRVWLQRGAALAGAAAVGVLTGPVGAVAGAAVAYGVTRVAGRRRERKMREQLLLEEQIWDARHEKDKDGEEEEISTQDETQSETPPEFEIPIDSIYSAPPPLYNPRDTELEQKIKSRFKPEGSHYMETSALTVTDWQPLPPTEISVEPRRTKHCG